LAESKIMKKKVTIFIFLIILLLLVWFFLGKFGFVRPLKQVINGFYKEPTTQSLVAYALPNQKALRFDFPSNAEKVRIVIRPILKLLPDTDPADIPHYVRYRFRYRLYGADNKLLDSRIYHGRQSVTMANILVSKARYGYHYKDQHALSARMINLPVDRSIKKGYLLIQLLKKEDVLSKVLLRVQFLETISKRKREMAWQHLSRKLKSIYQRGSVYGSEYTTPLEKDFIVSHKWRYLAPQGIPGVDFTERHLSRKIVSDDVTTKVQRALSTSGILIDRQHKAIVTLSHETNIVTLRVFRPAIKSIRLPITLRITSYGYGMHDNTAYDLVIKNIPYTKTLTFKAGILEVSSTQKVFLSISGIHQGKTVLLTAPNYVPTYSASTTQPLVYPIYHSSESLSPVRVDIRANLSLARKESYKKRDITYELRGNDRKLIFRGKLNYLLDASPYDFIAREPGRIISEPAKYHFVLPNNVKYLYILANHPVLVNVYTRPYELYRVRRIPEDFVTTYSDVAKSTSWFPLKPENLLDLQKLGRSVTLWVQRRPPEYMQFLLNKDYFVNPVYPQNHWKGHYILRKSPLTKTRATFSPLIYSEIPLNVTLKLNFSSKYSRIYFKPTLIADADKSLLPVHLTVHLDKQIITKVVRHFPATVSLVDIKPGDHVVRVTSDKKVTVLMNHLNIKGKEYTKHLVYQLNNKAVSFVYLKKKDPMIHLSGRLYVRYTRNKPTILKLIISYHRKSSYKPTAGWTYVKYKYIFMPDHSAKSLVLFNDMKLGRGRPFSINLNDDIYPGKYRLTFQLEGDSTAYLSLATFQPIVTSEHQFKRRLIR